MTVGPADGSCPAAVVSRIQSALDASPPGSTIVVCAGTYDEQLVITKPVRLRAHPGAALRPPRLLPLATSLRTGRPVVAGITVRARATLEGLAVDVGGHGVAGCTEAEPLLAGIFVRGVSATIRGTGVRGARITPSPPDCANGVGILVQGGGAAPRVRLEGNTVTAFQRAGISVQDAGVNARILQNLVVGDGTTPTHAQTGIEITDGVQARIEENVVRAHAGPSGAGCTLDVGIGVGAGASRVRRNVLESNAVGIRAAGSGQAIADNAIDGGSVGLVGLGVGGDEQRVTSNLIHAVASAGITLDGNRNHLRANTVADVHASPVCDALHGEPACGTALSRCGAALWLRGQANTALGTTFANVDLAVADDGRANDVR